MVYASDDCCQIVTNKGGIFAKELVNTTITYWTSILSAYYRISAHKRSAFDSFIFMIVFFSLFLSRPLWPVLRTHEMNEWLLAGTESAAVLGFRVCSTPEGKHDLTALPLVAIQLLLSIRLLLILGFPSYEMPMIV